MNCGRHSGAVRPCKGSAERATVRRPEGWLKPECRQGTERYVAVTAYRKEQDMRLRKYRKEDADIICSWIQDEKSLYQWSADRIGIFPISGDDLNRNYEPFLASDRFIPLTAVDSSDRITGHLFIRYPDADDRTRVRFGFVIIDPAIRGCGKGKEMLRKAIDYAGNVLNAETVSLGVFANNSAARHCYESVGFRSMGESTFYQMAIGRWECIEMVMVLKSGGVAEGTSKHLLRSLSCGRNPEERVLRSAPSAVDPHPVRD